jgi:hypothetical protein
MSRVAEAILSGNVYISGDADRRGIRDLVESMGGKIVTAIRDANVLIMGGFCRSANGVKFGVRHNPIDAIDYVDDHRMTVLKAYDIDLGF